MSVKVIDKTMTASATIKQGNSIGLRLMAQDIVRQAQPITPRLRGNLSRDILIQALGNRARIQWQKIYAQYQERGARRDGSHVVRRYTTGGTGKGFAEKSVMKVTANAAKYFKRTVR